MPKTTARKSLAILGTRGVPARHGGFETFAERLALHLVKVGWQVTVYCQEEGQTGSIRTDRWEGIDRVVIPVGRTGALGTISFDWRSVRHVLQSNYDLVLTLGYNTAIFCAPYRFSRITNVINMDGIEWKRDKWKTHERLWLWFNERIGCIVGNHLIADHPDIATHLATRVSRDKITMIPYGADPAHGANIGDLQKLGLQPFNYFTIIARPERENSILEIVKAFSRKKRDSKLVVLGKYTPDSNSFHREVLDSASTDVIFPGAIYEKQTLSALRAYNSAYIHGHTVGGTNPSLVEALGAGSAVLAHDNSFNRWVAGSKALYFSDEDECEMRIEEIINGNAPLSEMRKSSIKRHADSFTWDKILNSYESLLFSLADSASKTATVESTRVTSVVGD
ncbi:DUF1972 domain-containing protein [Cupriavidus necator]|uniref:DUF1972 domain-containing protein n=1 Tax=Cupriavidus necator TaxID=106590 RepID=UPI0039C39241